MANHALLAPLNVPQANIHRIQGEIDPHLAAEEYNTRIATTQLDLVMLGMGDDGHTASLFPETAALTEFNRDVVANFVPKLNAWRITLTAKAINAAEEVLFMVSGEGKRAVLHQILGGVGDYPARLIAPHTGKLLWFVDKAAHG